jgi:hypothetical protein
MKKEKSDNDYFFCDIGAFLSCMKKEKPAHA